MNGHTSSVIVRIQGNMFAGEQEGNEYLADGDSPRQILNGESSSIRACGGSGEGKKGEGLDINGFPFEKNALAERIEELEKELYDYQYHMGLLLIEKKMRTSEFEKLRERLSEARANLKLERAAFSSTLSEKQKQEAERRQDKLEKKERDLLVTQVMLPTREIAVQGEYGSPMIDDLLAYRKEIETEKVRVQKDKETLNTLYNRLQKYKQKLMKKRDILLSLPVHCKACMNCSIIFSEIDLGSLETFERAELADDIVLLSIPNEQPEKKRMKRQNSDSSPQSKPNASSINEQNESLALSSEYNKGRASSNKRTGSLEVVLENFEETLDDIPREINQHKKRGSEDTNDTTEESNLNLVNAGKMRGGAEQWGLLCHASGSTFEIDSCDRITQPAIEGHHKRHRTSDIRFSFPGQKRYNFRSSTILKVLTSKLQSEHLVLGRDSAETDIDYEPSNSD